MKYNDVIKEDKIDEYIRYHIKFFREIADINTDVFYLNKLFNFPFKELHLFGEGMYYSIITRNIFQMLTIKIHRLLNDQTSDTFTILKFKNKIITEYLKDEYKQTFINSLKNNDFISKNHQEILNSVKDARHEVLAHKNIRYFNGDFDNDFFGFDEIKSLVFAINDFFRVLSFDVKDKYAKDDYYNEDIWELIVDAFNNFADESLLPLIMNSEYISKEEFLRPDMKNLNDNQRKLIRKFMSKISEIDMVEFKKW
ncbi:hypothetical protein [Halalkalibacter hemicellulosilyticus]|uniref:HEPN AbiU2-like domain-containing protein n=1 Tax=Halalkalibacter hemicellulosilyticusJCM 9152 TaxID=1236971 RepID=W4QKP2_9BACI|nr:hypothetical protein [Halalkalibacter hemicellulosilyticus]GAE32695.1 hypothetical protein JCM9152_4255 [Halalkalibacter hemicellulosilyticusJCM 9152]